MRKESITLSKTCSKCGVTKPLTEFYKNAKYSLGVIGHCKSCFLVESSERKRKNRANPEFKAKELAYKKEYRKRTVEQRKQYMSEWRSKNVDKQVAYREANKERSRAYNTEYDQRTKAEKLARTRKRQTAQLRRTPSWLTDGHYFEMECIYKYCGALRAIGLMYEVDHIVPLQGKTVSGLHVPWNLQVIPALDNWAKNNRLVV